MHLYMNKLKGAIQLMHTHTYIHNLFQQVTKSAGPALTTYKCPKVKKEGVYT